ncbi:MAG TPA: GNAT family protein [Opitutaceae bacterium]|nr:GNAT family protein [Opitutaceae bacterium]
MTLAPLTLTGRYVRLEPLADVHFPALVRHGNEPDIWRWTPYVRRDPVAAVTAWRERLERAFSGGHALIFATISLATGEAIGGTSMQDISAENRSLEVGGTWLARSVWRTAVNTECKYLLLRHAFEVFGCNRVQLKTDLNNTRSQSAIERLGAKREGVLRSHLVMPDGRIRDSVMFSIIAGEWPGVRQRLETFLARPA